VIEAVIETVIEWASVAALWVWVVRFYLLAGGAGISATAMLVLVLERLERGDGKPVGRWITGLAVALLVMLGVANAFLVDKDNAVQVGTNNPLGRADAAYLAVAVVFGLGAVVWAVRRYRVSSGPNLWVISRASFLLLEASVLLLILLWVVQRAFEQFSPDRTNPSDLVVTIAGAGLLSMATVQGLRTLLPLRGVFHRLTLERWIDDSTYPAKPTPEPKNEKKNRHAERRLSRRVRRTKRILNAITTLARGPVAGERYALLDLPIEQLCGQVAAGADRLLDAPFATKFTPTGANSKDAASIASVLTALAAGSAQVKRYLTLARKIGSRSGSPESIDSAIASADRSEILQSTQLVSDSREYVRLRASLSQRIQRNIDGLQIGTTFWWRRVLRGLAFAICGVLGLSVFKGDPTFSVVCALVGGFIATAARDLVAVIEKARR